MKGARCFAVLVGVAVLAAACGHSTEARLRRLDEKERQLRASVTVLEAKQRELRTEIVQAQRAAESARCQARQESYRAVVASIFAEHASRVAEHKGCEAQRAKRGGGLAALGCGLAAFATGGVALALCGGGLALGYAVGSSGCSEAPPEMTPEELRLLAAARTGMPREPSCAGETPGGRGEGETRGRSRPARGGEARGHVAGRGEGETRGRSLAGTGAPEAAGPSLARPPSRRESRREARTQRKLLRQLKREEKRRARALRRTEAP